MPFKSEAQRKACYAKAEDAKKKGQKPKWNCKEYGSHDTMKKSYDKMQKPKKDKKMKPY